eukprot:5019624-Pyramimonas_sp.AAC.1
MGPMMKVRIPMAVRGRAHLTAAHTDIQLVHEPLSEEVRTDIGCKTILKHGTYDADLVMMTRAYQNHEH